MFHHAIYKVLETNFIHTQLKIILNKLVQCLMPHPGLVIYVLPVLCPIQSSSIHQVALPVICSLFWPSEDSVLVQNLAAWSDNCCQSVLKS